MSERFEKAKKGLACCERRGYCEGHCPYYEPEKEALECTSELAHDALALIGHLDERIKELSLMQVARVMTLEDAAKSDVCWMELKDLDRVMPCRIRWYYNSYFIKLFEGAPERFAEDEYGTELRCWTKRPTDEQREAVKWNG